MTVKRITYSELGTFKGCRREWWLNYYRHLGLKQRERVSAASLGTLVHNCMEALYVDGVDPRATLAELRQAETAEFAEAAANGTPIQVDYKKWESQYELAEKIVEGFLEWRAETGLDCGYRVVAVEEKVSVPVEGFPMAKSWDELQLMGKLDVQVEREADGAILNRDWKTVQTLDEGGLSRKEQFKYYALIKRLAGSHINGAQRVMLRKVKRTGNAKPPFYGIDEATYTDSALRRFHAQIWGEIKQIAEATDALDAGADPLTVCGPRPCNDCSWKCDFKAVCPMWDDGSSNPEGMLSAYYEEYDPLARYTACTQDKDEGES